MKRGVQNAECGVRREGTPNVQHSTPNMEPALGEGGVEAYIDKAEVARRLGKSLRTVEEWMQRGILPYYKIGRSIEFKWSEVEAHLAANFKVGGGEKRVGQSAPGDSYDQ